MLISRYINIFNKMARDTKNKQSKKEIMKRQDLSYKTKKNKDSSSEDDYLTDSSDYDENEEVEMSKHEYNKFLSKIFPSKHISKKIKSHNKIEKIIKDDELIKRKNSKKKDKSSNKKRIDSEEEEEVKPVKNKRRKVIREEEETDYDSDSDSDSDYETESTDDEDEYNSRKKSNKYNIIFNIGAVNDDTEDEWETDDDSETDDSEADDSETDDSLCSVENDSGDDSVDEKKSKKKNDKTIETEDNTTIIKTNDILSKLEEIYLGDSKNKTIQKCIDVCKEDIKNNKSKQNKKDKKCKDKNLKDFKKIMREKNTMNDVSFFKKIGIAEQSKIITELNLINKTTCIEKPYRMTLLESDMPILFKGAAMKKINSLVYMEPGSGEFYKIKNWVDTFMRLPFGKYETLPVNIDDGVEKCHDFMENAKKTLDEAVYGLNDAKMQIMQILGQLITNPKAVGCAIAIHGNPGTGKTSLVKEGISKILNRPFAFIALGGATDSSFLEGHSYTYEGSTWGKIVQILVDCKCMNPVIYFDELDKISDTPKGEEITGILTHLTDTTQNMQFHDKYFAEIDFDLSKCLFIFSYNDESKINPILRDRMYRIQTSGYNQKQKTIITNNYLLPKIQEQVKFKNTDIIIPDETCHYIIENLCGKEEGVRNLKRCLEIIYTKLNLYRLMKPESNLFEEEMNLKVLFPFTVTKNIVDKLIKMDEKKNIVPSGMYV